MKSAIKRVYFELKAGVEVAMGTDLGVGFHGENCSGL